MLTRKQHELLMFIHERIKETGVSPSFDEMKEALDLASKSGIHRLITALEERGFLRRLPHRARALEVVKLPQQATTAAPPKGRQAFRPQLVEASEAPGSAPPAVANDTRELPVLGRIAAGTPSTAMRSASRIRRSPRATASGPVMAPYSGIFPVIASPSSGRVRMSAVVAVASRRASSP